MFFHPASFLLLKVIFYFMSAIFISKYLGLFYNFLIWSYILFVHNSYDCSFLILTTLGLHTAKVDQVKFDVMELHARPELAAQQRMVDDASGDVKVRKKNTVNMKNTHKHKG